VSIFRFWINDDDDGTPDKEADSGAVRWGQMVAQISAFWREKCLGMALDMMGHWQKQTELWVEPINLGSCP
jgi:hypothetical protein